MFSNVLAFIISLGNPDIADARAIPRSAPEPLAGAMEVADKSPAPWVFAAEPLAPLKLPALAAVPGLDLVVNVRGSRRARAKLVRARMGQAPIDLRQALLGVRGSVPVSPVRDAGSVIVVNRDAGLASNSPVQVPGSARGFVRIGGGDGADTLWREEDGLFYVSARINGEVVRLIVDTGASFTVLSTEDARRIGVDPAQIAFADSADTAAGASPMARIVLANLEIGQNVASGVPAMVASGQLRTSLLGQNVLSRLGSITIEGDRMTLR